MQRLIWTNSKGDSINLTSGNFGITNWEGFANSPLNIQSQQVPFEDGSVFLDSLIENRELSVTLALNDDGDLEKRYRLRRELIKKLNPKLGEGYLIYTNDFISKRIKCIAQIPIPENHNSNDTGTPKFSLSWTACDPYWEDLEETSVVLTPGMRKSIVNNGDVPCGLEIDLFTNGMKNPEIKSFTENKKIKLTGSFSNNVKINTNTGKKSISTNDIIFHLQNLGYDYSQITYFNHLNKYFALMGNLRSVIVTSSDGMTWESQKINVAISRIIPIDEKNILLGLSGSNIYSSSDGINWTLRISHGASKISYFKNIDKIIALSSSGLILTSPDGINWTEQTVGTESLKDICYASELNLFVVVGNGGTILTSPDAVTWTLTTISNTVTKIIYSSKENIIVGITEGNMISSSNGTNWTVRTSSGYLKDICYSEKLNLFVAVGDYYDGSDYYFISAISSNGINWNIKSDNFETHYVSYYDNIVCIDDMNLFIVSDINKNIITSLDGINWTSEDINMVVNSIVYSSSLGQIVMVGTYGDILTSLDGRTWKGRVNYDADYQECYSVCYSKKLDTILIGGHEGLILRSNNKGITWDSSHAGGNLYQIKDICYSEKLNLFVAVGLSSPFIDNISISPDGVNWEVIETTWTEIVSSIIYSEEKDLFVAVGNNTILTSSDGRIWTQRNNVGATNLMEVCYSKEKDLFVICGDKFLTSLDGINWTLLNETSGGDCICYSEVLHEFVSVNFGQTFKSKNGVNWESFSNSLYRFDTAIKYNLVFSEDLGLFLMVNNQTIVTSKDGINWKEMEVDFEVANLTYSKELGICAVGDYYVVYISAFTETENLISNLTTDSDMTLSLQQGENELLLNRTSGDFVGKISFRQKYVGV